MLGGRGFIGTHLIDALLSQGHAVRCFDRPNVVKPSDSHSKHPQFELFEGDFTSEADMSEALKYCDICYHLVSTTLPKSSNANPVFDVESNLIGTIRMLTLALKAGVKKVIFVSSGGTVYGEPTQVLSRKHTLQSRVFVWNYEVGDRKIPGAFPSAVRLGLHRFAFGEPLR